MISAFGGTAVAALRMLDTGPDVQTLREQRANQQATHERQRGMARKRARGGRKKPPAGAAVAAGAPAQKPRARRPWGAKADAICKSAEGESLALIERYPLRTPADLLPFIEATVRLMGDLVVRIERLGPAPNRRVHARLMRELHVSVSDARRDLALLRTGSSPRRVERALDDRGRVINRLFRRLGSTECAVL